MREDATRVRVNVELIEASSGQVIWSEQYDREGVDVFAAQSDIALHVAKALNASVTLDDRLVWASVPPRRWRRTSLRPVAHPTRQDA